MSINCSTQNNNLYPINLENNQDIPQLTKKEEDFFTNQEPSAWFPLYKDQERIKCALPSDLRKIKKLIYIFRNKVKNCFLIGKTGTSLNERISSYTTEFNKRGSEERVKKIGRKTFLTDMKQHPEHFEVGILHVLQPEDDLNLFETFFIDCKRKISSLYNDHRGGGGGLAHSEENETTYAVPKSETAPFTPEKYYPYKKNDQGCIRPQLTPNFKQRIRDNKEETQEFAYVIKKLDTEQRYVGISGDPERRSREHAYKAEYFDPEHHKYDPDRTDGRLHPAMAKDPEKFGIGLLPVQSMERINQEERDDYISLSGSAQLEKHAIKIKRSLASLQGFNCNEGGGGPISNSAKRRVVKKIDF
jgi:GIY-YIG catalytic domain